MAVINDRNVQDLPYCLLADLRFNGVLNKGATSNKLVCCKIEASINVSIVDDFTGIADRTSIDAGRYRP